MGINPAYVLKGLRLLPAAVVWALGAGAAAAADVPLLVEHFLRVFGQRNGKGPFTVSPAAMENLLGLESQTGTRALVVAQGEWQPEAPPATGGPAGSAPSCAKWPVSKVRA